jgi:hypothetical protein
MEHKMHVCVIRGWWAGGGANGSAAGHSMAEWATHRLNVGSHIRDHERNGLVLGNGLPHGLALEGSGEEQRGGDQRDATSSSLHAGESRVHDVTCREYAMASSMARRARPTAPAATAGRVKSKAFMAILNPKPTGPSRFSSGTTTSDVRSGGRSSDSRCQPRAKVPRGPHTGASSPPAPLPSTHTHTSMNGPLHLPSNVMPRVSEQRW